MTVLETSFYVICGVGGLLGGGFTWMSITADKKIDKIRAKHDAEAIERSKRLERFQEEREKLVRSFAPTMPREIGDKLAQPYTDAIQRIDPKPRHVDTPFEKAMEELDRVPIEPTRDPTFAGATTDERRYDVKG